MEFIDLAAQYQHLKDRIDARVQTVLDHGTYIMGPEVQELEGLLSEYVGVKHTVTCANGTDALSLALKVMEVGPGDIVFCPTFTFFATAEVISSAGVTPIFVDSDPVTFNICPTDLDRRVAQSIEAGVGTPKAIIAVDLFGLPADYESIQVVADKYQLKVIEDAAQGFGGEILGKRAGSFGDIATTSFFPAKPLGCYGDGGALFTNNDEYAELLRSYRIHGKGSDKYDNVRIGVNSRLDTLQAAILLEKLAVFPAELEARNRVAKMYANYFEDFGVTHPSVPDGYFSSWAQYTLKVESRESLKTALADIGVPSVVYYPKCMHEQTAFASLGYRKGDFPVAEALCEQVLSLPMHGYVKQEELSGRLRLLQPV